MTDPTQGTVSEWAGAYITATPWTRPGFFSPIIVNDDDTVDISGTLVTPSYDPTSNMMSFDWVNIVNSGTATTAKGELTFFSGGLTGLITPRPQDKPLPCTGQLNTLPDHPTLANAVPVPGLLDTGDTLTLAAIDGRYVTALPTGELVVTTDESSATLFTVTVTGIGITLQAETGYVCAENDNDIAWANGPAPGTILYVSASLGGGALISTGGTTYLCENAYGKLQWGSESSLVAAMEFEMRVTPVSIEELARRYGVDLSVELTDCEIAEASFLWQVTGGLFFALGLGPFIASGKVQTQCHVA